MNRPQIDPNNLPPNYPKKDDPDEAQRILAWQMSNAAFKSLRTPIIDPKAQLPVAPVIDSKNVPAVDPTGWEIGKKIDTYSELILLLAILIPFIPPF